MARIGADDPEMAEEVLARWANRRDAADAPNRVAVAVLAWLMLVGAAAAGAAAVRWLLRRLP